MRPIKRRIVTEEVDAARTARRAVPKPVDKDETLAQEARALLGGRRRAFSSGAQGGAPAEAPAMPARQAGSRSRSGFTAAERQAMYDHATGATKWRASQAEHGEAMDMLLDAGMPRHQVYAKGANQRLSRKMAKDMIDRMPRRR
jgi:hypothetical protein